MVYPSCSNLWSIQMNCVNCNHGSLVRSNFRLTPDGKPYCIKNEKCVERYNEVNHNPNARQKGDKVK